MDLTFMTSVVQKQNFLISIVHTSFIMSKLIVNTDVSNYILINVQKVQNRHTQFSINSSTWSPLFIHTGCMRRWWQSLLKGNQWGLNGTVLLPEELVQ